MDVALLSASHPLRPVDWRWQLAKRIAAASGPSLSCPQDRAVQQALCFRRLWFRRRSEADGERLARLLPALHTAHALFEEPGGKLRLALEARLLAQEPLEDMARKVGAGPDVLDCYRQIFFFDVGSRLANQDYVLSKVIDLGADTGFDFRRLCLFFGYFGGPAVLDELLCPLDRSRRPQRPEEAVAYLSDAARARTRHNLLLAVHTLATTHPGTALRLVQIDQRPGKGKEGAEGGELGRIQRNIQAMLENLPLRPWDRAESEKSRFAEYDRSGTELRAKESLLLSMGIETEEMRALKHMKFPSPENVEEPNGFGESASGDKG